MANQANIRAVITAEDRASGALRGFANKVEGVGNSIGRLAKRAGIVLAGATTAAAVFGVKTAASLESSRQGFITLLGSAEKADKTMARIKKEAARTPFEIAGLTQATQMLAGMTEDGDRAIDFVLNIGEGLAAMGRGQAELDRISVNLQQIAATGRAYGIDIKQFAFAGIPIFKMLQKETGLSGDALDKFIENGGVTFEMLEKMFDRANDKGGQFFNAYKNQTNTLNQLWSNLKDTFAVTMDELLVSSGAFDAIKNLVRELNAWIIEHKAQIIQFAKDGIQFLKDVFTELKPSIQFAWDVLKLLFSFIKENMWVVTVLAGAFVAVKTAMFLTGALQAFKNVIGGASLVYKGFAALIASPLTLPAIAVGAALASLGLVIAKAVDLKKTLDSTLGNIKSSTNSQKDAIEKLIATTKAPFSAESQARARTILHNMGVKGYAGGTNYAPGGMAVVGEQGPELVNLPRGSQVIPNNKMGGTMSNVSININAGAFMGSRQDARKYAKMIMEAYQEVMGPRGRMA